MATRNRREAAEAAEAAEVVQEEPREEEIVNQTLRKRRFSRSEMPFLHEFVFQVPGLQVNLQQQRFLPQSILECG